ncbi:conserved hypothetical protein [Trichinella spiralis]|uniref:hypothetical protein n=1 Tax=Trichinella spiralis TaxID=6334 RepID=UPI0001EFC121|nr:conserved hypothetical protein [Trichinella spiralis]
MEREIIIILPFKDVQHKSSIGKLLKCLFISRIEQIVVARESMPLNCFILGVLLNVHHHTLKTFSVQFIAMQCALNALPRPVLATLIMRTSAQLFITQPRHVN